MKARSLPLIASLIGLALTGNATPVPAGLVAHYEFNNNLNDSSGHGLDLNPGGTFHYTDGATGWTGSAVQLVTANPANGTFFLGTGPSLANQSSSVAFWFSQEVDGPGSWVFGLGHPAGTGGALGQDMNVAINYGPAVRYSFFYDDFDIDADLPSGAWTHLAFTFDYSTSLRSIYINGNLEATNTAAFPFSGGNSLKIGFDGTSLDDLRFYNRALSADEVATLARVPEAGATIALLSLGLLGLATLRRRLGGGRPRGPAES